MKLLNSGLGATIQRRSAASQSAENDAEAPVVEVIEDEKPVEKKTAKKKTARKSKTKKTDTPEPEPVVEKETKTGTDSEDLLADVSDGGEGDLLDI